MSGELDKSVIPIQITFKTSLISKRGKQSQSKERADEKK